MALHADHGEPRDGHLAALRELEPADGELAAGLLALVNEVARQEGLHAGGFRVLTNDGPDAGQSVGHLHFHVLGGKKLRALLAEGDDLRQKAE